MAKRRAMASWERIRFMQPPEEGHSSGDLEEKTWRDWGGHRADVRRSSSAPLHDLWWIESAANARPNEFASEDQNTRRIDVVFGFQFLFSIFKFPFHCRRGSVGSGREAGRWRLRTATTSDLLMGLET